jgi:tRNA (cmo5U34)-methyltransferase
VNGHPAGAFPAHAPGALPAHGAGAFPAHGPGGSSAHAAGAFSAHAADYDAPRRRLVPGYDAFYGAVTGVLERMDGEVHRVLDLGAGTGLLSAEIVSVFPGVELELLDAAEPMLRIARKRLGAAVGAVHVADMAASLPDGPFDAVVSALAIHHLEHSDQRRLLGAVHRRLRRGGVFVNAEQISGPTPELTAVYDQRWAEGCRLLGASKPELDDARARMRHDRCADLESHLRWLREAGFPSADCIYKSWRFAVLVGFKENR